MANASVFVNFPSFSGVEFLENHLGKIAEDGFDGTEFNLSSCPLIIGGEASAEFVEYVKKALEKYPLKYTGHIGTGLNLRNLEEYDLHKNVLKSSIDICGELKMSVLTLHFEEASLNLREEKAFYDAHAQAAEYAKTKGVLLCIENIETEHHTKVVEMVRTMGHDNFRMTLDTGHLYLSANYFGHSFEKAVEECAPYTAHLHLSDNTGKFEKMRLTNFTLYKTLPMGYRITFGLGDIRLPPLWGKIDYDFVLRAIKSAGFTGIYVCEYENGLFVPFNGIIQKRVRQAIENI